MNGKRGSPEKTLQKSILEWIWVAHPNIVCWLQPSTGTFSKKRGCFLKRSKYVKLGIPDIIGWFPSGHWLAIEVKIRPKKPTEDQELFLTQISNTNGVGFWTYSLDAVESMFRLLKDQRPDLFVLPSGTRILAQVEV